MKKIKENKGITLIALIITIIVLIILAVVAINAVQGDGIIAHAKNARDEYQTAQEEENTVLENYLRLIKENENSENEVSDFQFSFTPMKKFTLNNIISNKNWNELGEGYNFGIFKNGIDNEENAMGISCRNDDEKIGDIYIDLEGWWGRYYYFFKENEYVDNAGWYIDIGDKDYEFKRIEKPDEIIFENYNVIKGDTTEEELEKINAFFYDVFTYVE